MRLLHEYGQHHEESNTTPMLGFPGGSNLYMYIGNGTLSLDFNSHAGTFAWFVLWQRAGAPGWGFIHCGSCALQGTFRLPSQRKSAPWLWRAAVAKFRRTVFTNTAKNIKKTNERFRSKYRLLPLVVTNVHPLNSRHVPAGGLANVSGVACSSCSRQKRLTMCFGELVVAMQHTNNKRSFA